jgi:hypothetical protein
MIFIASVRADIALAPFHKTVKILELTPIVLRDNDAAAKAPLMAQGSRIDYFAGTCTAQRGNSSVAKLNNYG